MRIFPFLFLCVGLMVHCVPKPTEKIDLSKARTSFQLYDGSSISLDGYDEVNPIMMRMPDDSLVLLFESDRPCSNCSGAYYNLFITTSFGPYYPGDDLPVFDDPVALNTSGSPLEIAPYPTHFQATFAQGGINIVYDTGSGIYYANLTPPNFATGDLIAVNPVPNGSHQADTLVYVDYRQMQMITFDGSDTYSSLIASTDSGTIVYNEELGYTAGATSLVPAVSGYTDSTLYEYGGALAMGTQNYSLDYMYSFNDALDDQSLTLSYVSAFHHYNPYAELVLFSAGSDYGFHDLYVVDSHTLFELMLLDGDMGYQYFYDDNFRIFTTAPAYTGNLGGVAGADNICNNDPLQPDINAYYAAMLVDASQRIATTNGTNSTGQLNWVLTAGASYTRASDGASLGTADGNAFLALGSVPANGILGGLGTAYTGMAANWTTNAGNTCSDWTTTAGNGAYGDANSNGAAVIYSFQAGCTTPRSLYCVEQ